MYDMIKPIKDRILFKFLEDLDNTSFHQKTESGIFVVEKKENQVDDERWGKVMAVGPEVEKTGLVKVGDYILMEALGWTNGMQIEEAGPSEGDKRFWFTKLDKVICVSDEEPELEY